MSNLDLKRVIAEVAQIDFGNVNVDPAEFAKLFQRYIEFGSQRYNLSKNDLIVYANAPFTYEEKEEKKVQKFDEIECPTTLLGLLANGTKFLDAAIWLGLDEDDRPTPLEHAIPKGIKAGAGFPISTFNDHQKIARFMFVYFFYILTRAKAPTASDEDAKQPIPNFIRSVLGIQEKPSESAEYLASFSLTLLNPRWVQHINMKKISIEALNRFGLGVAGYRVAAPFKLYKPEKEGWQKYQGAIDVAISISKNPADWGIHPSTRDPNLLTKYGNLNKNISNLMLEVFTMEQLDEMVRSRIIFAVPNKEPAHTNYKMWTSLDIFVAKHEIFKTI